jgi:hypothetical protein
LVTERNWSSLQEAEAQRGEPGADRHMISQHRKRSPVLLVVQEMHLIDRSVPWPQLTLHGKEKVYGSIP